MDNFLKFVAMVLIFVALMYFIGAVGVSSTALNP